jgi:hypothetical protein
VINPEDAWSLKRRATSPTEYLIKIYPKIQCFQIKLILNSFARRMYFKTNTKTVSQLFITRQNKTEFFFVCRRFLDW